MQTLPGMTQQPMQPGSFDEESQEAIGQQDPQEGGEQESGGFSIDSQQIEAAIKDHMDDKQETNLDRVLKAGNDLLFGKETHYQLMDSLKDSQNIGKDLGEGAFGVMASLLKSSGNSIPGDVVIPAGVILLARAAEFINKSGINKITDDDFEEAAHIFNTQINHTYNPEFRERMKQSIGDAGNEAQQPEQQAQPMMQQQQPQGSGLLQQQSGG